MMRPELPWDIYIRTSTFEQGEKSSPLKQFNAAVGWAKANGKTVPGIEAAIAAGSKVQRGEHIFVDHQTGTNDDRPEWQRFMQRARSGKSGGVICYMVDRAARNMLDAMKIHSELKRMKVGFKFAMQNFDDSPVGEMMFGFFAMWAQFEVTQILERTHDGRKKRTLGIGGKKDGKPRVQGKPLYGYRLEDGVPVEDEKEGPVARFYLRMALESTDNTCGQIAVALNKRGYRMRNGAEWDRIVVADRLRQARTYAGVYTHHHGIEAAKKQYREAVKLMGKDAAPFDESAFQTLEVEAYPPMITMDEANLILARVEKNRLRRGRPTKRYALSHKIWCDVCGERWYAQHDRYYCACTQLGKPKCSAVMVGLDRMDGAVINGMRNYLKQPEVHYALAIEDYNASRGPAARTAGDIEKEVRELAKEQAHYDEEATAFRNTPKQREIARRKSEKLVRRISELNAEARQLSVVLLPSKSGIVAAFGAILAELNDIDMQSFAEKRKFVESTIERVDTDGRQVKVRGTLGIEAVQNKGSNDPLYCRAHLDAPVNISAPISFAFSVSLPPINQNLAKAWETRRRKRAA